MKYAVLSPEHQLICFDHSGQVAEYCLEYDGHALDDYCGDEGLTYETMTPTEIGQAYTNIGAVAGGCQIFETREILDAMAENAVEPSLIEEANLLFNNRRLNEPINCPGFLEDILGEVTPITAAQMTEGIYFMDNIDSCSEEKDNG